MTIQLIPITCSYHTPQNTGVSQTHNFWPDAFGGEWLRREHEKECSKGPFAREHKHD